MDKYKSLAALRLEEPSTAYSQLVVDRQSWLTVVAPHGGTIEPSTDIIAKDIAGNTYNLFVFCGLRTNGEELHVTSHLFRDSELERLQGISNTTLSVHGKSGTERLTLVGGLNRRLRQSVVHSLREAGFNAKSAYFPYAAENPENFVNLTSRRGVQLEITMAERIYLCGEGRKNGDYERYTNAVRRVLNER